MVKLQIYEGPLDLLLHLIKKNEVDLDDIPIALITAQYLEYLDLMESMNVELASDFLVMAATLTQIKSRLLLPREDDEDQENDPAEELKAAIIDPLLDHLRQGRGYHDVVEVLKQRCQLNSDVFLRGGQPLAQDEEEQSPQAEEPIEATLFDLMDAFRRLSEKKPATKTMQFVVENKTIGERVTEIQSFLREKKRGTFSEICQNDRDQGDLVLSFLSILELGRISFLRLYQNLEQSPDLTIFLANPEASLSSLDDLGY